MHVILVCLFFGAPQAREFHQLYHLCSVKSLQYKTTSVYTQPYRIVKKRNERQPAVWRPFLLLDAIVPIKAESWSVRIDRKGSSDG